MFGFQSRNGCHRRNKSMLWEAEWTIFLNFVSVFCAGTWSTIVAKGNQVLCICFRRLDHVWLHWRGFVLWSKSIHEGDAWTLLCSDTYVSWWGRSVSSLCVRYGILRTLAIASIHKLLVIHVWEWSRPVVWLSVAIKLKIPDSYIPRFTASHFTDNKAPFSEVKLTHNLAFQTAK